MANISEIENSATIDRDTPEDQTQRNDFMRFLKQTLTELNESQRTAFTLGVMQKLPYREIEEITGWSESAVKINIFRARQKVAMALQEFPW